MQSNVLMEVLSQYPSKTDLIWFQDEPSNMGGWYFMTMRLGEAINSRFKMRLISRVESASPSTGSSSAHKMEQAELLEAAFKGV
jgi:2-oxoglutarate dehydrogenase E1 component